MLLGWCRWFLLGFAVNEKYYFDIVLPFGGRSSPYLFCLFSEALHWITSKFTDHKHILHYIDDFLFIAKPASLECQTVVTRFVSLCQQLGVPLALNKVEGPTTRLIFLGVVLDSVGQTVSLPEGKPGEYLNDLLS